MEPTQLHLLFNHLPIVGLICGILILLVAIIKKNKTLRETGLIILAMVSLLSIPAFLTGEDAEHQVEEMSGTSEHYLEEHEELGETAIWAMAGIGVLAVITFILSYSGKPSSRMMSILTLLLSLLAFGLMVLVADHGGKIRRPELQTEHEVHDSHETHEHYDDD